MPRKAYTAEQIAVVDQRFRLSCHPPQRAFVFDPARRVSLLTGRGAGKTSGELMRMLRKMVSMMSANCLYVAATRESAERIAWTDLKRIVTESLKLTGAVFNESKLTLTLQNGSSLLLFGCDDRGDIQKLRGKTWREVAIDEVASIKIELLKELLIEVIGPRLVGTIVLLGTPGKRLEGLFYDVTRPGGDMHRAWTDRDLPEYKDWLKYSSHSWEIKDGADAGIVAMEEIYREQLLTKQTEGWSDDNPYWLREYRGKWAADDSTNVYIYRAHKPDGAEHNQWTPTKFTPFGFAVLPDTFKDWGYGIGIDVGFKDAFALEVFAFSYSDPSRTLYHVYEIYRTRLYAQAIAKLLIGEDLNHAHYGGIVGEIGWPDAMVGDFANAGGSLLTELQQVYGVVVKAADKPYKYKDNAVELMNSDLFDGRLRIMKGSHLAGEMSTLQWVVDAYGKRAENKAQPNHACDAALYIRNALAVLLPSAAVDNKPPVAGVQQSQLPAPVDDDLPKPKEPEWDADAMYSADESSYAPGDW